MRQTERRRSAGSNQCREYISIVYDVSATTTPKQTTTPTQTPMPTQMPTQTPIPTQMPTQTGTPLPTQMRKPTKVDAETEADTEADTDPDVDPDPDSGVHMKGNLDDDVDWYSDTCALATCRCRVLLLLLFA